MYPPVFDLRNTTEENLIEAEESGRLAQARNDLFLACALDRVGFSDERFLSIHPTLCVDDTRARRMDVAEHLGLKHLGLLAPEPRVALKMVHQDLPLFASGAAPEPNWQKPAKAKA